MKNNNVTKEMLEDLIIYTIEVLNDHKKDYKNKKDEFSISMETAFTLAIDTIKNRLITIYDDEELERFLKE